MQASFQKKAEIDIQNLSEILQKMDFSVSDVTKKIYNYEVNVVDRKTKVKVQVYYGKKGVKRVLQGDETTELYQRIKKVLFGENLFNQSIDDLSEPSAYIGTDEAGKGDFFGPLVVAAFYVNSEIKSKLFEMEVKDSKLLSDFQIKNLAGKIKKLFADNIDVVVINPEKYNQLYSKFGNLNELLSWAHSQAIKNLSEKFPDPVLIIDKFCDEKIISKHLRLKKIENQFELTPKAERFLGVAAASILAREKFLNWFTRMEKEIGIKIPKGASTIVDDHAKKIVDQYNAEILSKLVKLHFKNIKNVVPN